MPRSAPFTAAAPLHRSGLGTRQPSHPTHRSNPCCLTNFPLTHRGRPSATLHSMRAALSTFDNMRGGGRASKHPSLADNDSQTTSRVTTSSYCLCGLDDIQTHASGYIICRMTPSKTISDPPKRHKQSGRMLTLKPGNFVHPLPIPPLPHRLHVLPGPPSHRPTLNLPTYHHWNKRFTSNNAYIVLLNRCCEEGTISNALFLRCMCTREGM